MTSTCCACEALPFKRWNMKEQYFVKMASSLERALQQRDRKVRAFHAKSSALLWAQQRGEVCGIVFPDTIRMNYFGRKRLKLYTLYSAQEKSGTQTHLFAPCDKLFAVWSGELRMQRHDLQNNKWNDFRHPTQRQRFTLYTNLLWWDSQSSRGSPLSCRDQTPVPAAQTSNRKQRWTTQKCLL